VFGEKVKTADNTTEEVEDTMEEVVMTVENTNQNENTEISAEK